MTGIFAAVTVVLMITLTDSINFMSAPFAALLNNPSDFSTVCNAFCRHVSRSFDVDTKNHGEGFVKKIKTEDEKKRRISILFKWFRILRGESGFSIQHAVSESYNALISELQNKSYVIPDKNKMWAETQEDRSFQ